MECAPAKLTSAHWLIFWFRFRKGNWELHTAPHTPTQDGERRNALRYTRRPSFLNTQNSGVETRWRGGCRLYYIYSSLFMYYEDF